MLSELAGKGSGGQRVFISQARKSPALWTKREASPPPPTLIFLWQFSLFLPLIESFFLHYSLCVECSKVIRSPWLVGQPSFQSLCTAWVSFPTQTVGAGTASCLTCSATDDVGFVLPLLETTAIFAVADLLSVHVSLGGATDRSPPVLLAEMVRGRKNLKQTHLP